MSLTDLLWLCTAAYGIHAFEEFMLDWRDWARDVIKLPVTWPIFYVVNFLVIVLGVCAAQLAATQPAVALAFPALMLINATFFHVAPMILTRGRYSPGTFTAVILFYPLGYAAVRPRALGRRGVLARRGAGLRDRRLVDGKPDRAAADQGQAVFPAGVGLVPRTRITQRLRHSGRERSSRTRIFITTSGNMDSGFAGLQRAGPGNLHRTISGVSA